MPNWIAASLSKPTCSYKNNCYALIFGTQQGLLGRPLRPQNPLHTNGDVMANGKRTVVKRLRFTDAQVQVLEQLLETENMIFTDFIHLLIAREFMSKQHTVLKHVEITDEPEKVEIKRRHRRKEKFIPRSVPKLDPDFLRELGRIGNNINQIARSLNFLCAGDQRKQTNFSFIDCLDVLVIVQADLHQHLEKLPPINRSEAAIARGKQRAIDSVTEGRS